MLRKADVSKNRYDEKSDASRGRGKKWRGESGPRPPSRDAEEDGLHTLDRSNQKGVLSAALARHLKKWSLLDGEKGKSIRKWTATELVRARGRSKGGLAAPREAQKRQGPRRCRNRWGGDLRSVGDSISDSTRWPIRRGPGNGQETARKGGIFKKEIRRGVS